MESLEVTALLAAAGLRGASREEPLAREQENAEWLLDALLDLREQIELLIKQEDEAKPPAGPPGQRMPGERLVDLGAGGIMFARARADEPGQICVDVGAGVYVQLPLQEALPVVERRIATQRKHLEELISKRAQARVESQVLQETLQQLSADA